MGRLLGDADVWDDTPAPPRPLRRGLAMAGVGLLVGLAAGWAVAPRPAPPAPVVSLPLIRAAGAGGPGPATLGGGEIVAQAGFSGTMLAVGLGGVEAVKPDGSGRRAVSSSFVPVAVAAGTGGAPLAALGGNAVVTVDRDATIHPLTPGDYRAGGLARRGDQVLACGRRPLPLPQRLAARKAGKDESAPAPAMVASVRGGAPRALDVGCPVAWAARADVVVGAGGPQVPYRRTSRGASVLIGPPGGPLRTLLDQGRLEAATGKGASVGAVAVSPDGRRVAVAAGAPGGRWALLLLPVRGGRPRRLALAPGYEAAWLGWSGGGADQSRLALAAVDRRGDLGEASLASRDGNGYMLGWDQASGATAVLVAGPPMERADGFAFSPDGQYLAVSSPGGSILVRTAQPSDRASLPVTGTLVGWVEAVP